MLCGSCLAVLLWELCFAVLCFTTRQFEGFAGCALKVVLGGFGFASCAFLKCGLLRRLLQGSEGYALRDLLCEKGFARSALLNCASLRRRLQGLEDCALLACELAMSTDQI